jgi:hypothetical protein
MPRREEPEELNEHRVIRLLRQIIRHQETIMAFIDDVNTKLQAQSDAINALAARIPAPGPPVDPATIVSVADQQTVLAGIDANTAKVTGLAPAA